MQNLVAFPAKRDQVGLRVVTKGAASSDVVNIEILRASTFLAAPTIAFQDLPAQLRILPQRLSISKSFGRRRDIHVADSPVEAGCSEAANETPLAAEHPCFCSDSPAWRSAPARKSAQIISSE
jgi:hypothetical protein